MIFEIQKSEQDEGSDDLMASGSKIDRKTRNIKELVQPSLYLKTEFVQKAYHQIANSLHLQFPKLRLIRGDGNCYYRAVILAYLELVILEGEEVLEKLIHKWRHRDEDMELASSTMNKLYLGFAAQIQVCTRLEKVLKAYRNNGIRAALEQLYILVVFDENFDRGLIRVLRKMAAAFIREHEQDELRPGLLVKSNYDQKSKQDSAFLEFQSLEDYVNREVDVLGAEAEGLVCEMVPILLRVKIVHVLIDKHSGGAQGYQKYTYRPKLGGQKFTYDDGLDLHRKSIHLWITPGHYNLLYNEKLWNKIGEAVEQANEGMEAVFRENEESKEEKQKHALGISKDSEERKSAVVSSSMDQSVRSVRQGMIHSGKQLKLSCTHLHQEGAFKEYLEREFGLEDESVAYLDVLFSKEKEERPSCLQCGKELSFFDFQTLGFKFKRNQFKKKVEAHREYWKEKKEEEEEERRREEEERKWKEREERDRKRKEEAQLQKQREEEEERQRLQEKLEEQMKEKERMQSEERSQQDSCIVDLEIRKPGEESHHHQSGLEEGEPLLQHTSQKEEDQYRKEQIANFRSETSLNSKELAEINNGLLLTEQGYRRVSTYSGRRNEGSEMTVGRYQSEEQKQNDEKESEEKYFMPIERDQPVRRAPKENSGGKNNQQNQCWRMCCCICF